MSVVVVSWFLMLLAIFGTNYSGDALDESRAVALENQRHQLRAWALSGVEVARIALENSPAAERSILAAPGPDNPLARTRACGEGRFAVGCEERTAAGSSWRPGLADEAARLPAALMDSTTLALLPGMTRGGVHALLEARRTAGENLLPPFELLPLDGTSLECARTYLTRYGRSVNANTAPREVLRALGLPMPAVTKLLRVRAGADGLAGTADDAVFLSLDDADPVLRRCGLNSEEAAVLALLRGSGGLRAESRFYRLAARGWGGGLDGICEIHAVLERPEDAPVRIVAWSEEWLN